MVDRIGTPVVEVAESATVGPVCVFDRVDATGGEVGRAEDVAAGPDSIAELKDDRFEASEPGTVVAPAVVLHASPTTEKRPNRVTPQLECDFCCAMTCCAIPRMAAVFIAPGSTISGVAKTPPEGTADEVPELVEDGPDELVGIETAELVGTELNVADVEAMLLRDWLLDWTEAD